MCEPDDPSPLNDWSTLINGLKAGEKDVLRDFYERYRPTLFRIVDRRVNPSLKRRFDADDVVQSTLRTFFRRVGSGQLDFEDDDRLWNLLCAITLTKLREKVRFHTRMRRAIQRDSELGDDASNQKRVSRRGARNDAPDYDLEFEETFEAILASLPEDARAVVDFKLQGRSNLEIAADLQVSERTIQRMLLQLQSKFESALAPSP